jgi:hypothetical protein
MAPSRSIVSLRRAPLPGPAPAAKTTAGALDRRRYFLDVRGLEVTEDRLGAVGAEAVRVVGVSDQPADPVASCDQQARQAPSDLPVATGDRYVHDGQDRPPRAEG